MTERKPGVYDFDVIRDRRDELRKEMDENIIRDTSKDNLVVESPPAQDEFMYCNDAFKMEGGYPYNLHYAVIIPPFIQRMMP